MLSVGEMMRHDIVVVAPDTPVRRIIQVMVDAEIEAVLVVDGRGHVVGSIGDEQLVAGLHAGRRRPWFRQLVADRRESGAGDSRFALVADELMLGRVVTVDPSTSVQPLIRLFDEFAVNIMPVVDHGILVGAVFRSDLVRRLLLPFPFGHHAET
jgi:predicted transcriptional regulator